jgi:tricorn protease
LIRGYTVHYRLPAWSPDGLNIAYWSDRSGEYELYLQDPAKQKDPVQMTTRGKGFGYQVYWSPDSKKIAFIDETNDISILDVESKEIIVAGNYRWNYGHGGRYGYPIAWSPDSKWISYTEGLDNTHNGIFLYKLEDQKAYQVSSGFYDDSGPIFSEDGKYLYFLTNRNMEATYSDMGDGTWVYPNSTQIAAVALLKETPSLLKAKNDELKKEEDKENGEKENGEKEYGEKEVPDRGKGACLSGLLYESR